jgi:ubiquinone/menaquinone biosynthesis C-methylase UbiE
MKLHLGCGNDYLKGWVNVDLYAKEADIIADVLHLPFEDNSADAILAQHVIEHFHYYNSFKLFKEWYRVLKPGGWLIVECPDLKKVTKAFLEKTIPFDAMYVCLYGEPWKPGQTHYYAWFTEQLIWALKGVGFKQFVEKKAVRYTNLYKWSMHLEAQK